MDFIVKILADSLYFTGPILLVSLGGLFAYKAGVVNIGLDGMMGIGALTATLVLFYTHSWIIALIAGIISAILIGMLFSFFGITKKANFIITGFAINLLATALGKYVLALEGKTAINVIGILRTHQKFIDIPLIKDIPILGNIISGQSLLVYFSFLSVFLVSFVIYKTKFGTYVRVVGESEEAAKSVGINIHLIKYLAVIIGAIFALFAGYDVAIHQISAYTPGITAGIGFIAIAAIYCGDGNPKVVAIYAILFGLSRSLATNLAIRIGSIAGLLQMIPYLMIVVVLSVVAIINHRKSLYRGFLHE
jgi:simple sugar transport system permease protein